MNGEWHDQKSEIFAVHERNLRAKEQAEHEKATAIIKEAIAKFREAGIDPHPLKAQPYHGSRLVKTDIVGWYLKSNRTVGIDIDGNYYILSAPGDLMTRLRGAHLNPKLAPLVVGRGGRDGEAIALSELLELRLEDPVPPARRRQP